MAAVNRGVDDQPNSGHLNAEKKWPGKLWRCTGSALRWPAAPLVSA